VKTVVDPPVKDDMAASEADELREAVREFLATASSSIRVRELMDTAEGYDPATWRRMASELGLHGIAVPEQWGGAGAGTPELAVVFEEMGAALLSSPFFSTVGMAAQALLAAGDLTAMADYLPAIADGTCIATLILNGHLDAWDPTSVTLTGRRHGDAYTLSGEAARVLDGHTVDLVLAAARTDAGISLFAVSADADGVEREALSGLDRTRKIARIQIQNAPARLVGADGAAAPALARASDLAIVALAAEQVGAAQRCLDMAVAYAKERIQFGRAIGSFQAVKHRCADMLVLVEGARSAAAHAAEVADTDELPRAAAVAKMVCSEALLQAAVDNMRIHGGIGFTWEHDAHLYVRRAKSAQLIFGSPDYHAQRLADLVTSSH
jgi:alkylation response protein AidB-like acyl-CoA dehydrogenase